MSTVEPKTVYEILKAIDCKQHIKVLQNNKYIPWSDAWYEVKNAFPRATYKTHTDEEGNPFFASAAGIFIHVTVYIEDEEQSHFYPVLNSANKALKMEAYTYKVKEWVWDAAKNKNVATGKMIDKYVEPATSFDINTAIMRGLTKCVALMGMALYVYRDELHADIETLSSGEMQEIINLSGEKGVPLAQIAQNWNVNKIAEIYASNFDAVIDWLNQV